MISLLLENWRWVAIGALCVLVGYLNLRVDALKKDVLAGEARIAILQTANDGFKAQVDTQNAAVIEMQKAGERREEAAKVAIQEAQVVVTDMAKKAYDIRAATAGSDGCKSAQLLIERVLGLK